MTTLQAFLLGLVEGLTEYLPVSSTGHLILTERLLGIDPSQPANAFLICIQAGAIAAVLGIYFPRVKRVIRSVLYEDELGRRLRSNLLAAFAPAAVIGFWFHERIERFLFGLWPIVIAWFLGGVVIVIFSRKRGDPSVHAGRGLDDLTWKSALVIGLVQCLSMWPGVSRSLVTIAGGLLVGMRLVAAVEFSFLLGMITLTAAASYKALVSGDSLIDAYHWQDLLLSFAAATLSAAIAVKWMVAYLNQHSMAVFGYYRIALAIAVGTLLVTGLL